MWSGHKRQTHGDIPMFRAISAPTISRSTGRWPHSLNQRTSPPTGLPEGFIHQLNRGEPPSPLVNVGEYTAAGWLATCKLTLPWDEIVLGMGAARPNPRVGRFNSPAHQLRRKGYRTIGEVCQAAGVADSTLTGWEGRFVPMMQRVEGVRVVSAEQFDSYVASCIEVRKLRSRSRL